MNKILTLFMAIVLFLGITTTANATTIHYDVSNLSGSTWEYNYTVENDMLAVDIEEFSISFDLGFYENLTTTSTPLGWDAIAFDPDPFIPDHGLYDALALVSGIAPGDSLSGFSISFDWLGGISGPGAQFFEIVDPFFNVLDSGLTTLASAPIPEPSTVFLLGIGLVGLAFISLRFRRQRFGQVKLS